MTTWLFLEVLLLFLFLGLRETCPPVRLPLISRSVSTGKTYRPVYTPSPMSSRPTSLRHWRQRDKVTYKLLVLTFPSVSWSPSRPSRPTRSEKTRKSSNLKKNRLQSRSHYQNTWRERRRLPLPSPPLLPLSLIFPFSRYPLSVSLLPILPSLPGSLTHSFKFVRDRLHLVRPTRAPSTSVLIRVLSLRSTLLHWRISPTRWRLWQDSRENRSWVLCIWLQRVILCIIILTTWGKGLVGMYIVLYRWYISRGKILQILHFRKKLYTENKKFYMVHTLFFDWFVKI